MLWNKKNNNNLFLGSDLTIANYLSDGLLVFDKNNKLVLVNLQTEEFFQIRKEKILGKSILELNRFPNFGPLVSLLTGRTKETTEFLGRSQQQNNPPENKDAYTQKEVKRATIVFE